MEVRIPAVMIPVINEACKEKYSDHDLPLNLNNIHVSTHKRRESDTCIILGEKRYHGECESTSVKRNIGVRMLEYDMMIAVENAKRIGEDFHVYMPAPYIIFLRNPQSMPDTEKVWLHTKNGFLRCYKIPI